VRSRQRQPVPHRLEISDATFPAVTRLRLRCEPPHAIAWKDVDVVALARHEMLGRLNLDRRERAAAGEDRPAMFRPSGRLAAVAPSGVGL